jgi:hypothetical protein
MDLDELAQQMHLRPDSMALLATHAEFIRRRQTEAQLEAGQSAALRYANSRVQKHAIVLAKVKKEPQLEG